MNINKFDIDEVLEKAKSPEAFIVDTIDSIIKRCEILANVPYQDVFQIYELAKTAISPLVGDLTIHDIKSFHGSEAYQTVIAKITKALNI